MQERLQQVNVPSAQGGQLAVIRKKECAEQAIRALLAEAKAIIETKMHLTQKRQQQKDSIFKSLQSAQQQIGHHPSSSNTPAVLPVAEVRSQNNTLLQASTALLTAFSDSQKAQHHLQQCLRRERSLLALLETPLQ